MTITTTIFINVLSQQSVGPEQQQHTIKAGLHVRVNFRECYQERLATTFRRESKSWLAGSLRSLLRAPELRDLSEYEVSVYT